MEFLMGLILSVHVWWYSIKPTARRRVVFPLLPTVTYTEQVTTAPSKELCFAKYNNIIFLGMLKRLGYFQ